MQPTLIGHRGARGLFPENTLEGLRRTIDLGLRTIEIDVGVTRDGVVVLHHDPALNPDTAAMDGFWPGGSLPLLTSLTFADLQEFQVGRIRPGSDYAARYPDQQPIDGATIPTLAEALTLDRRIRWYVEVKVIADRPDWTPPPEEMVERVLHVADQADAAGRIVLQSFDWRAPRHARRIRPDVARAWLTDPRTIADPATWWQLPHPPASVPEAIAAEGGGGWSAFHADLAHADVQQAHALGLTVVAWTVNEAADMRRLAGWGVDGIITDRPDRWPF